MRSIWLAFTLGVTPASADSPLPIVPDGLERQVEEFGFSPAVRAGDFIFVSGVVAGIEKGVEPTPEAVEAGYQRVFARLEEILVAAGAEWSDVAEMTTYHTDLPAQGEIFIRVKNRRMTAPYPAWTAIDVDRLWPDNGITEIRLTVYKPQR
jgi:enamine deaminase RidA (YjgF/YER057c/UK114 family)